MTVGKLTTVSTEYQLHKDHASSSLLPPQGINMLLNMLFDRLLLDEWFISHATSMSEQQGGDAEGSAGASPAWLTPIIRQGALQRTKIIVHVCELGKTAVCAPTGW